MTTTAAIPRVWEVHWAVPAEEGGTPWASYRWLLRTAAELGHREVTILAAAYSSFERLHHTLGRTARALRGGSHQAQVRGITVHGMTTRGHWHPRGPVLVAFGGTALLTQVESARPPAIAAVASWPDDIAGWRSSFDPTRVGQIRAEVEAEHDTMLPTTDLDPRILEQLGGAFALVNENHSVLSTHERERVAGGLVRLRAARVQVDREVLRAHLMRDGWNGRLISEVIKLSERVDRGVTSRR